MACSLAPECFALGLKLWHAGVAAANGAGTAVEDPIELLNEDDASLGDPPC